MLHSSQRTKMEPQSVTEALARAIKKGDVDTVRTLLSQGADPNAKFQDVVLLKSYADPRLSKQTQQN